MKKSLSCTRDLLLSFPRSRIFSVPSEDAPEDKRRTVPFKRCCNTQRVADRVQRGVEPTISICKSPSHTRVEHVAFSRLPSIRRDTSTSGPDRIAQDPVIPVVSHHQTTGKRGVDPVKRKEHQEHDLSGDQCHYAVSPVSTLLMILPR